MGSIVALIGVALGVALVAYVGRALIAHFSGDQDSVSKPKVTRPPSKPRGTEEV